MNKQKILIVDDDENIAELISLYLTKECFDTKMVYNGEDALRAFDTYQPNLILLDLMLPGEDGYSILEKLKKDENTRDIPIIMVTAKDAEYDKVKGLEAGADDYITKPFGMMEFVARIKAVLRRTNRNSNTDKELKCGDLRILVGRHEVFCKDEKIELTRKEFELLVYLVENRGLVMSRNQILCQVWGYEFEGETRTVDVHVRSLRQNLGEAGNMVETVRGVGYRIDK